MDGLRKFIEVDNQEAVNVGGLRLGTKSVQVVKNWFTADFPEAVIREGAEESTSRAKRWAHDAPSSTQPMWRPRDGT